MNNRLKESQLRAMVRTLLEDKTLGPELVKVNPVVDPSAAVTDPSNPDYKPNTKQELQVALTAMIDNMSDDVVPSLFDSIKNAMQAQEDDKGKDQMAKSNAKIEETIRLAIRSLLENVELPRMSLKEYYAKDLKLARWFGRAQVCSKVSFRCWY